MPRINLYANDQKAPRIRAAAARAGFQLSHLLEAAALCLTAEELQGLRARFLVMKRTEAEEDPNSPECLARKALMLEPGQLRHFMGLINEGLAAPRS